MRFTNWLPDKVLEDGKLRDVADVLNEFHTRIGRLENNQYKYPGGVNLTPTHYRKFVVEYDTGDYFVTGPVNLAQMNKAYQVLYDFDQGMMCTTACGYVHAEDIFDNKEDAETEAKNRSNK